MRELKRDLETLTGEFLVSEVKLLSDQRKIALRRNLGETETICEHCGAKLPYLAYLFEGRVVTVLAEPVRCDCEKAQAYWAEQDAKEKAKEEKAAKILKERQRRESAGLPLGQIPSFRTYVTDTDGRREALKKVQAWAKNPTKNLVLEGSNRTGKTHLITAATNELSRRGAYVRMALISTIYSTIKEAYDRGAPEYLYKEIYTKPDVLVIDDLGKERVTDWTVSTLFDLIDARYRNGKVTAITTNYNRKSLVEKLTVDGDVSKAKAIVCRIYGGTHDGADVVTMNWEEW